jgi:hypothetical protein
MSDFPRLVRTGLAICVVVGIASCGGGGGGGGGGPADSTSVSRGAAISAILGLPQPIPLTSNGSCASQTNTYGTFNCISSVGSLPSIFGAFIGNTPGLVVFPSLALTRGSGSCGGGVDPSTGTISLTTGFGNDSLAFSNASVISFVLDPLWLGSLGAGNVIKQLSGLIYLDNSNLEHFMVVVLVNGNIPIAMSLRFTNLSPNVASDVGSAVICAP